MNNIHKTSQSYKRYDTKNNNILLRIDHWTKNGSSMALLKKYITLETFIFKSVPPHNSRAPLVFTTNTSLHASEDHNWPYLFPSWATVQVFQVNKGKLGRLGRPIADSNWSGRSTKSSPPLLPGFSVNKSSLPTCEGWDYSKYTVVMVYDNAKHWDKQHA